MNHTLLQKLAEKIVDIQSLNEAKSIGTITKTNEANEIAIKTELKNFSKEKNLRFQIYGEEFGMDDEKVMNPDFFVTIDPVDGIRFYGEQSFFSAITLTFHNNTGEAVAGIIISINNQKEKNKKRYRLFSVVKGEGVQVAVYYGFRWMWDEFTPTKNDNLIETSTIDVTFVKDFLKYWQKKRVVDAVVKDFLKYWGEKERVVDAVGKAIMELNLASLRVTQNMSGCSSILAVIEGKLGCFINFCINDIVSHNTAILIAKELGFKVRHLFSDGDNFSITTDENLQYKKGDGTILIAANSAIEKSVLEIIQNANIPNPL